MNLKLYSLINSGILLLTLTQNSWAVDAESLADELKKLKKTPTVAESTQPTIVATPVNNTTATVKKVNFTLTTKPKLTRI